MSRARIRTAGLLAVLSLAAAAPAATIEAAASTGPQANASKTCSRGTHASLPWGHKCLSAGQFCKRGQNRYYHRYGFHCKSNGHLRRY